MKRWILVALVALTSPAPQQPLKVRIEGVVVRPGTGEPVPRARLTLTSTGRGGPLPAPTNLPQRGGVIPQKTIAPAVTDDLGRFSFQDLDEGSYTLQILANGYVSQNYGQRFAGGSGTPIVLTAGQDLKNLSVTLTPAGNIGGRVVDRLDQPLVNVPLRLMRYSYDAQGQRSWQAVGSATTNDRGEYRIYWITPGRYILMAGIPGIGASPFLALITLAVGSDTTNNNDVPVPMGYAFYPGVSDIGAAQIIDLKPGADIDSANITLTTRPPTYRIRGRVIDSRTGQPPALARVIATPRVLGGPSNSPMDRIASELPLNNYNSSTGTFEIRDLLPGSYAVAVAVQDPRTPSTAGRGGVPPPGLSTGTIVVGVSDTDVEGVVVTVVPAATLAGRLRAEGSQQLPVTPDRTRLQLISRDPAAVLGASGAGGAATPSADGTFRFANIAVGEYRVVLQTAGGRGGAGGGAVYLKEARLDGADVLNTALRISGSAAGTLEIVAGVTNAQISGIVSDRRAQPVAVAQVVLIPDRARDRIDLYKTATADDRGRFSFPGIPPGDYKVFSWEFAEPFSWFDPELLAQSETKGTAVHVTDTSSEMIEVKLIPKEGSQ